MADTVLSYPDRKAEEHSVFLIVDPDSAGYVVEAKHRIVGIASQAAAQRACVIRC
jgi:hypothetical protein